MFEEHIEFAVRFATANLDHFREGDWSNAREELSDFLGNMPFTPDKNDIYRVSFKSGKAVKSLAAYDLSKTPEKELRAIQSEMRQLLELFVGPRRGSTTDPNPV